MTHKTKPTVKQNIMTEIETKEVMMTPKYMFTLKKLILEIGLFTCILIAVLALNAFLYTFTQSEAFQTFRPGIPGLKFLLRTFPFAYVTLSALALIAFRLIWKRFDISYKEPYRYILPALVVLLVLYGIVAWKAGIASTAHQRMFLRGRMNGNQELNQKGYPHLRPQQGRRFNAEVK